MLTEEQKREFERIFNFYSLQKEQMESLYNLNERTYWLCKDEREWTLGAMKALREVAEIFGYKFESKGVEIVNGLTCSVYRLEEI